MDRFFGHPLLVNCGEAFLAGIPSAPWPGTGNVELFSRECVMER